MVLVVDDLENLGLIERQRDPGDRRRYALRLTDRGRAKLAEANEVDAVRAEVVDVLGEDGELSCATCWQRLPDPARYCAGTRPAVAITAPRTKKSPSIWLDMSCRLNSLA